MKVLVAKAAPVAADPAELPTFYEFLSGGGLVRLELGDGWRCVGAVDNDPKKIAAYAGNFGSSGLVHNDVRNVGPADIPEQLNLAWASFPCVDLSIAGSKSGMDGISSGAFWPCWETIRRLVDLGRAPHVIALENVRGLVSSNGGRDFAAVVGVLCAAGYRVGAVLLDAARFVPQSRKRVFIVAVRADVPIPVGLSVASPSAPFHTPDLVRTVAALPPAVRKLWVWWSLPVPEPLGTKLTDLLDPDTKETVWHPVTETEKLIAAMGTRDHERMKAAQGLGGRQVGTICVRMRAGITGRTQNSNVRTDGLASCLVTPAGRGSAQIILAVNGDEVRTRYMTPQEGARLMGIPASYKLPRNYNAAF